MPDRIARVWTGSAWEVITSTAAAPTAVANYQSSAPSSPVTGQIWVDSDDKILYIWNGSSWSQSTINLSSYLTISSANATYAPISSEVYTMTIALSDESTSITTGAGKLTMRAPFAMTLTQVPRASLSTASTSGIPTIDINVSGSSILSTKLTIDATEKTSTTATTPAILSTTSIADDAEITFDIDTAGTGAKGLKVTLFYKRS